MQRPSSQSPSDSLKWSLNKLPAETKYGREVPLEMAAKPSDLATTLGLSLHFETK